LSVKSINDLRDEELKWVNWIKKYTVPNTYTSEGLNWTNDHWLGIVGDNTISPSVYAVAVGTWWSLSEQIISDTEHSYDNYKQVGDTDIYGYRFNYNECTEMVDGVKKVNFLIGPNEVCKEDAPGCGSCWQNGIFGAEMHNYAAEGAAIAAENIYKGKTYWDVIKNTMQIAGFSPGSNVYNDISKCFPNDESVLSTGLSIECADLVKIWLIRNHLVGLSFAVLENTNCLNRTKFPLTFDSNGKSFCMGNNNMRISNGFDGIYETINFLAYYFSH
ncbi:32933_t:CDS:1, partial [Gigaspora margarita]